jgi:hypothetical protein
VPPEIRARIDADLLVIQTGWVTDTTPCYHIMDVFALPAHREGFGLVSAEAQASGVPVVSTTATGADLPSARALRSPAIGLFHQPVEVSRQDLRRVSV